MLTHCNKRATDDSGMTVTELMVVLLLMGVVLTTVYTVFGAAGKMSDYTAAASSASDENRMAMDRVALDIRQALGLADSGNMLHVFTIASPREATLYSQPDSDTVAERIHYYVSGNDFIRAVSNPTTGTQQSYPGSWLPEVPVKLVNDLSPSFTGPIFTYLGASGVTSPTITAITAVSVRIVTAVRSGSVTASVDTSSMTTIRSVIGSQ